MISRYALNLISDLSQLVISTRILIYSSAIIFSSDIELLAYHNYVGCQISVFML